jgi:hypothetical protein
MRCVWPSGDQGLSDASAGCAFSPEQIGAHEKSPMAGRGELADHAWRLIAPLLPTMQQRGGQWRDHEK